MTNRITGRSAFVSLMRDEGVTHLFGNPGTDSEIRVGPAQGIDLPALYVKDTHVFGLSGAFLTAKAAL